MKLTATKVGDWYEFLGAGNAEIVAQVLNRQISRISPYVKSDHAITCGVPYHEIDQAVAKLKNAGHEVEILGSSSSIPQQ